MSERGGRVDPKAWLYRKARIYQKIGWAKITLYHHRCEANWVIASSGVRIKVIKIRSVRKCESDDPKACANTP